LKLTIHNCPTENGDFAFEWKASDSSEFIYDKATFSARRINSTADYNIVCTPGVINVDAEGDKKINLSVKKYTSGRVDTLTAPSEAEKIAIYKGDEELSAWGDYEIAEEELNSKQSITYELRDTTTGSTLIWDSETIEFVNNG
jgi:hypothetical protein